MKNAIMLMLVLSLSACGGSDGEKGEKGDSGLGVTSNKECSGGGDGYILRYQLLTFASGDSFVICYVWDSWGGYSNSKYAKKKDSYCSVGDDVDTVSYGFWTFIESGSSVRSTYVDSGSSNNGASYTLTCTST